MKAKTIILIASIFGIVLCGYLSRGYTSQVYQKIIDKLVQDRTDAITNGYKDSIATFEAQIADKNQALRTKDVQLKQKQKQIDESNKRLRRLMEVNEDLKKRLASIKTPATQEEIKARMKGLGYEVCN